MNFIDNLRGGRAKDLLATRYLLHGAESLRSEQVLNQSRNSRHFMDPEDSLPQSQVPITCPYSEQARSSPSPLPHPTS